MLDNSAPGRLSPPAAGCVLPRACSASRARAWTMNGPSGSRPDHTAPTIPPGTRMRPTSRSVGIGSIQCHDDEARTASAQPSGSGIDSPRPASARAPGTCVSSTARMRSSGSIATTSSARSIRSLVNAPVPAPRSTTLPTRDATNQSTAATGGPGRYRSYCDAMPPKLAARSAFSAAEAPVDDMGTGSTPLTSRP